MKLLKTSFFSSISILIKLVAGLIINKTVSIYLGPSGLAMIGQFQNFSQSTIILAGGGIQAGITKICAEEGKNSLSNIRKLMTSSFKIVFSLSVLVSSINIFFSTQISNFILDTDEYFYIFEIFGVSIFFISINSTLLALLNGLKEIKLFVIINILQSIYILISTVFLIYFIRLEGAFIALTINQAFTVFITLYFFHRKGKIRYIRIKSLFKVTYEKKLLKFSLMSLIGALSAPITIVLIRDEIAERVSWSAAGLWQAIWYISNTFSALIITIIAVYYIPRISEISNKCELRTETGQTLLLIMIVAIPCCLIMYFFREHLILILFSEDFIKIETLFYWQLIGTILKLLALLLAYFMLAKLHVKEYIFTEMLFNITFYFSSIVFIDTYGLIGMTYSFTFTYLVLLAITLTICKKYFY